MPLTPRQKEKLKELELEKGGVAFASAKSAATPNPTVVISLGGLGGKTLNVLKGKFKREIGSCDHIFFRMIDTSKKDTEELCTTYADGRQNPSKVANLDIGETIALYNSGIAHMLKKENLPPTIAEWLNTELIGTELDNTGARQIRQIGRAMLANGVVYPVVRQKLETVILDAIGKKDPNGHVDVIVIAGISGGTGSGTVVDISYMLHDIFRVAGCNDYRIAGYIFTPDVQFLVPTIQTNPGIQLNLKKNGYAALKEIDYFMNIFETNSVYRLKVGASEIVSSKNIFNSCTLVSGYAQGGGLNKPDQTIGRLTDQLMDMLTDISVVGDDGMPVQMSSSIMSNENAMLGAWFGEHLERKSYHRYASYKYQVLGYSSITIPRDEILAYCVNKIYERVIEEFQNLSLVNKEMMGKVYNVANLRSVDQLAQYALTANPDNPINRTINGDDYSKRVIVSNPNVAYEDACEAAKTEAAKINGAYLTILEDKIFQTLKSQVDRIFDEYGPFVALKAIEHKHDELSVGNPNEPFPGIVERLYMLSDSCLKGANKSRRAYVDGGSNAISQEADNVRSAVFGQGAAISQYVSTCCSIAVATNIDARLYDGLAQVLQNVAARMEQLNHEMFEVYTQALTEVQKLLNEDGQYFSQGVMNQEGENKRTFTVDIIKSGRKKAEQLESYLGNFIAKVSVKELADNFINRMKANKDKWLAMNNENDFDVVTEIRALMDECLENSQMKTDIIEKFVAVAYSPRQITPEELELAWNDNSADSLKIKALTEAAHEIWSQLKKEAQPMANTTGGIPLDFFNKQFFVSVLKDTPQLSAILANIIAGQNGHRPATSSSSNKFIMTQQYMSLPMYILQRMDEYNQTYIENKTAGRHMDEKGQNWGRFQNPYTIDAVASSISAKGRPFEDVKAYEDYQILMDVKQKTKDGIQKYKFVDIQTPPGLPSVMYLYDVVNMPNDMKKFEEDFSAAYTKNANLDVISFMRENGFVIHPVEVTTGETDIEIGLLELQDAPLADQVGKYKDVPVPEADVYKWLRKSIKYMDILDKCTAIFEDIQKIKDVVDANKKIKGRYVKHIETFAYALRTGMVKQNAERATEWNYMNGQEPVRVNFGRAKKFDKDCYLYHLFVKFYEMEDKRLDEIRAKAEKMLDDGNEVDVTMIVDHVKEMLNDAHLGDPFNAEPFNEAAEDQAVTENYTLTDKPDDVGNPYKVLKRFYSLFVNSIE